MKKILLYIIFLISLTAVAQQNQELKDQDIECKSFRLYKENAHASYYHNKFNGRKTASGKRFDNSKLTAAHKKLPFGTILKVTNPRNKKYVIVKVTDRGPFINGREIDLTEKAFMDIASNKGSGVIKVKIEIMEK
ncbi:septal ring lytic transglycosylase RlpA family protein [Flavobacterium sp. ANB]|uniref:septal ring lytic transglycosylase RlpA family protein n=1 Tax=unclassified Flavobacterium TaxID=196869 RepID=UPI0012B9028C|nr:MULTISPECIES: septal ring lytic transglycosylase RlpA family protein [unclassified Flavobacterium]MBF4517471.1 septal ring lytic transglycosylase RlpA family protein [Flavobacterium sp. ANB]MTD72101.1 septal ring lytic transglycosylase RlpA family protein [Flavobacterium sp. LC2016-13]